MKTIKQLTTEQMLQQIRNNHIDIQPIIDEELKKILPTITKDIISNVYNMMEVR